MNYFKVLDSNDNSLIPLGCKVFGLGLTSSMVDKWLSVWRSSGGDINVVLILAGSKTAEIEGISAAGSTSVSRKYTAVADAELFLKGPKSARDWPLPPLPAGVSPALISYVSSNLLGLNPTVVALGLPQTPSFPCLEVESRLYGPANCLSSGHAMDDARVEKLWQEGLAMGLRSKKPLVLAECVPGGTTTALGVLTGLGISAGEFVSGSLRYPPKQLKQDLVKLGLRRAAIDSNSSPKSLVAAIGDPFQPFAAGLLIGARRSGLPVLLGGGSQMVAVLALAIASIDFPLRASFVEQIAIGTTAWLAEEKVSMSQCQNSLFKLMSEVGKFFDLNIFGLSSGLRFDKSSKKVLQDYEHGYIKEGVGAGGLSLLAQINGISCNTLLKECEVAVEQLQKNA